jgi:hypothetical protein
MSEQLVVAENSINSMNYLCLPKYSSRRNDDDREVMYLYFEKNGHSAAVGVINNRTWNSHTIDNQYWPAYFNENDRIDFKNTSVCSICESCSPFHDVTWENLDELKLEGFGTCGIYTIDYFLPQFDDYHQLLGIVQTTEEAESYFGKLDLKRFPILKGSSPFVFFKAEFRHSCLTHRMLDSSVDETRVLSGIQKSLNLAEKSGLEFDLSNDHIVKYWIYDAVGRLIFECSNSCQEFDINSFVNGVYITKFQTQSGFIGFNKFNVSK